jgi:hypothetical protein
MTGRMGIVPRLLIRIPYQGLRRASNVATRNYGSIFQDAFVFFGGESSEGMHTSRQSAGLCHAVSLFLRIVKME